MQDLIPFLKNRLQYELPHSDIRKEGLSEKLLKILLEEEKNAKSRFAQKPPRICAVMVAFYCKDEEWFLPMMRRPDNIRAHPGQISFPGGRQEEVDEDLIATAIRETEEEIGITVPKSNILGNLTEIYIAPSNSLVTPIVAFLDDPPLYIPDEKEVAEVLDIRLTDLQNTANIRAKKVVLTNGDYFNMPAYQAENNFIWGGTARMIAELLKLLKEKEG